MGAGPLQAAHTRCSHHAPSNEEQGGEIISRGTVRFGGQGQWDGIGKSWSWQASRGRRSGIRCDHCWLPLLLQVGPWVKSCGWQTRELAVSHRVFSFCPSRRSVRLPLLGCRAGRKAEGKDGESILKQHETG